MNSNFFKKIKSQNRVGLSIYDHRIRLFECPKSIIGKLSGIELKESIRASEGRIVLSEVVTACPPLVEGVSNVELARAFGADMILLNLYDIYDPKIPGAPEWVKYPNDVFELTGAVVGVNLEPIPKEIVEKLNIAKGRIATPENAIELIKKGAKFLFITGNPETNVTVKAIAEAVKQIKEAIGEEAIVLAGKVNASGVNELIVSPEILLNYVKNGADGVSIPFPGTIPDIGEIDALIKIVKDLHAKGALVMCSLNNSMEGVDNESIKLLVHTAKILGADIYHIGDAGYSPGISVPENILCFSIAVKGRRHAYRRMAMSILR
jgi:hypothetical protein